MLQKNPARNSGSTQECIEDIWSNIPEDSIRSVTQNFLRRGKMHIIEISDHFEHTMNSIDDFCLPPNFAVPYLQTGQKSVEFEQLEKSKSQGKGSMK